MREAGAVCGGGASFGTPLPRAISPLARLVRLSCRGCQMIPKKGGRRYTRRRCVFRYAGATGSDQKGSHPPVPLHWGANHSHSPGISRCESYASFGMSVRNGSDQQGGWAGKFMGGVGGIPPHAKSLDKESVSSSASRRTRPQPKKDRLALQCTMSGGWAKDMGGLGGPPPQMGGFAPHMQKPSANDGGQVGAHRSHERKGGMRGVTPTPRKNPRGQRHNSATKIP